MFIKMTIAPLTFTYLESTQKWTLYHENAPEVIFSSSSFEELKEMMARFELDFARVLDQLRCFFLYRDSEPISNEFDFTFFTVIVGRDFRSYIAYSNSDSSRTFAHGEDIPTESLECHVKRLVLSIYYAMCSTLGMIS